VKPSPKKKDEEEVCFICFDGGDLVVCDRRFVHSCVIFICYKNLINSKLHNYILLAVDCSFCVPRFCPKAYHHSCVNRDDEFFKSKGQWTCGMFDNL
jgi:hypothetical protein